MRPQEAQFAEGFEVLAQLPPACFQPSQLLHLFPQAAARWLPSIRPQDYWGLHGGLAGELDEGDTIQRGEADSWVLARMRCTLYLYQLARPITSAAALERMVADYVELQQATFGAAALMGASQGRHAQHGSEQEEVAQALVAALVQEGKAEAAKYFLKVCGFLASGFLEYASRVHLRAGGSHGPCTVAQCTRGAAPGTAALIKPEPCLPLALWCQAI